VEKLFDELYRLVTPKTSIRYTHERTPFGGGAPRLASPKRRTRSLPGRAWPHRGFP
jgi:hypothetical protein